MQGQSSRGFRPKNDAGERRNDPNSSRSGPSALESGRRSIADAEARSRAKAGGDTPSPREKQLNDVKRQVEERLKKPSPEEPSPPLTVPDRRDGVENPGPVRGFERDSTNYNAILKYRASTRLSDMTIGNSAERDIAASKQRIDSTRDWAQKAGDTRQARVHFGGETIMGGAKSSISASHFPTEATKVWEPGQKEFEAMREDNKWSERFPSQMTATESTAIGVKRAEKFMTDEQRRVSDTAEKIRRRTQNDS